MKAYKFCLIWMVGLTVCFAPMGWAVEAGKSRVIQQGEVPQGMDAKSWNRIQEQLRQNAFSFDEAGRARNRAHDFSIAAEQAGLDVNGLLRFRAAALNGVALPEAEPKVTGNRVEYRRPSTSSGLVVTEWFVNKEEGLEQGFTIAEVRSAECGAGSASSDSSDPSELQLLVDIAGARAVTVEADGQRARITNEQGRDFGYGGLKAWDVTGRALACRLESFAIRGQWSEI